MTTGFAKDQHLEKQMQKQMGGCITGFFQIFDRPQILCGKRHLSAKRLPPSPPVTYTTSESEKSAPPSPKAKQTPPPPPKPLPELKEGTRSPWKYGRETPRLSLDSRATTDAKGGLHPKEIRTAAVSPPSTAEESQQYHRSPSVIARLMGLEPLQPDTSLSLPETNPLLRRSASESRVNRDLFQSRFIADKLAPPPQSAVINAEMDSFYTQKTEPSKGLPWKAPHHHRKSFFDSGDFFPEPKQSTLMYGEIEHRLRIRGINETSKDLENLKLILETLQLKGLLHSGESPVHNQASHRNFVYEESPITVAKPRKHSNTSPINRRNQARGVHRNHSFPGENSPPVSPRPRSERTLSSTPSPRREGNNSVAKPKPLSVETQRRKTETTENRKGSPVHSPRLSHRKTGPDLTSPRKKSTAVIQQKIMTSVAVEDESSSISGSSTLTTSTDNERFKAEEHKEGGKHLLERCGKLLHSIAEITAAEMQPSPVSVLDSSFYKDELFTPSPITRRNLDFKGQTVGETEDYEICSPEFAYVSDILRASHYLPEEEVSEVFHLLEKQQHLYNDTFSKVSRIQRKLVFDTVNEILDKDKRLPPWKANALTNQDLTKPYLNKVWSEFERIRELDTSEDLFETVCGVLKKDLAKDGVDGWGECTVEMSEVVLDIERLIFKDLVGESIGDLTVAMMPRRKLVF